MKIITNISCYWMKWLTAGWVTASGMTVVKTLPYLNYHASAFGKRGGGVPNDRGLCLTAGSTLDVMTE